MLNDANNAYNANNGHQAAGCDVEALECMLYVLLFAWADAYNNIVNAYNAHDTAGGS